MTAQEIFDRVATHLHTQGRRSQRGGKCLYRGPSGLQCAAGCLITDDEYSPQMENKTFPAVCRYFRQVRVRLVKHAVLIESLQRVHDHRKPHRWPGALRRVAKRYDLNPSIINKLWGEA